MVSLLNNEIRLAQRDKEQAEVLARLDALTASANADLAAIGTTRSTIGARSKASGRAKVIRRMRRTAEGQAAANETPQPKPKKRIRIRI
ncbi:MAG: hypothetical protein AAGA22_07750 [Pseudomonadota bacterium]